jgi:hypothetical protein
MSAPKLPRLELFLFLHELESMPDYSCTFPSATTIGKVWRRREPYRCLDEDPRARHFVGMYVPAGDADHVRIIWFDVVLRAGPAPRHYEAPDWHNQEAWEARRRAEREAHP